MVSPVLEIIKDVASIAGAVVSISAALAVLLKPLRHWLKDAVKKSCVDEINESIATINADVSEMKEDTKAITTKIDTALDMLHVQHKASCDTIRGEMLQIYYRYLPYQAIPYYVAEQFSKLATDYASLGGNSFMTETIIPAVKGWQVITDPDYFNGIK